MDRKELLGIVFVVIFGLVYSYCVYLYEKKKCDKAGGVLCLDECVVLRNGLRGRRWYNGDVVSQKWYIACAQGKRCVEKDCFLNEDDPI